MGAILTRNQKHILAMSKAQYLSYIGRVDSTVNLQVAAAVFKIDVESSRPMILLLRRKTYDSLDVGHFEIPSGLVDDNDFIISDSVARAVKSQSSLRIFRIDAMLREQEWTAEHSWCDDDIGMGHILGDWENKNMQLNWAVTVDDIEDVVVLSAMHDEFIWASWASLSALHLSNDTRDLAKEALTWAARRLCA